MRIIFIFALCFLSSLGFAQSPFPSGHTMGLGGSYLELKDELNHGFVFRGPDLRLNYTYKYLSDKHSGSYRFTLGGGGKTALKSWAGIWFLSPVDAHFGWNITAKNKTSLYLGPSLTVQYNVQNYPELHAGPILWFSQYDLGIHLESYFTIQNKPVKVELRNSLFSLVSRPPTWRNPYYFSTQIGENFQDIHSNTRLRSVRRYNHNEISISIPVKTEKRQAFWSYHFSSIVYKNSPEFRQLFHQISYQWYLKPSKK